MTSFTPITVVHILSLSTIALAGVLRRQQSDAVGTVRKGAITYYNTGGGTGACGTALSDSEAAVALSTELFDQYTPADGNPNQNTLCGKQIEVTSTDGTRTAVVKVADRCGGCAQWDLDLTPCGFDAVVADGEGVGRTTATWVFLD